MFVEIPYTLIKDLFLSKHIHFYRRGGGEDKAKVRMDSAVRIEPYSMFISMDVFWSMGAFSYSQSTFPARTTVGRYCSLSNAISVFNSEHPTGWITTSPFAYAPESAPVFMEAMLREDGTRMEPLCSFDNAAEKGLTIGNDVWIGQNVLLKQGITIADGAVVAAGAVLTKDVPEFTIVGGIPAKPIRQRFDDKTIERIKKVRWWQYHIKDFSDLRPDTPEVFLDGLERRVAEGLVKPYMPEAVTALLLQEHLRSLA